MPKKVKKDLVKELRSYPNRRMTIFRKIPPNDQGFILLKLSKHVARDIVKNLSDKEMIELTEYLDPDESTDILQILGTDRRKIIVKNLTETKKEKVEYLLKFNPRTAAGMMSLDYIELNKKDTFNMALASIKKHEKLTGKFPSILIIENGFLIGELPAHTLAMNKGDEKINKYVKRVPSVKYNQNESAVIDTFKKHPHNKIVVLDEDESIMGIIYSDDIIPLLDENSENSLRGFAGIRKEEDVLDSAFTKVKNRYKWLIINLGTAFLAASVVSLFQETISAFVMLAVYMPIVAGMGGNAGIQALVVVVRGISMKEVSLETGGKVILNEMLAGGINGMINGVLVAGIAILLNQSPILGFIVGVSMVINLVIAGFFGSTIPLLMKRLGKDPASSAGIFITTATDVLGFFIFLGLASVML